MLVCLVIGHFTWFDELREKLELEHKLKLAEEAEQARQALRAESCPPPEDPFSEWENSSDSKEDFVGTECDFDLCIAPHHSILCPNNCLIPSLNEPLRLESSDTISILGLATRTGSSSRNSALLTESAIERPLAPALSSTQAISAKNSRFVERDLESGRPVRSSSASPSNSSSSSGTHTQSTLDISKLDMI
jgi:hypothetical protein